MLCFVFRFFFFKFRLLYKKEELIYVCRNEELRHPIKSQKTNKAFQIKSDNSKWIQETIRELTEL